MEKEKGRVKRQTTRGIRFDQGVFMFAGMGFRKNEILRLSTTIGGKKRYSRPLAGGSGRTGRGKPGKDPGLGVKLGAGRG